MADCRGELFLRELVSADFFSDWAIRFGSFHVKTPYSRSRALLCWVTSPDQYFLPLRFGSFWVLAFGNEVPSFVGRLSLSMRQERLNHVAETLPDDPSAVRIAFPQSRGIGFRLLQSDM